jgi:pyrroloquinoline quinone biosynthesis protein B
MGDRRVKPRTQTSLAVSADGEHWILVNAAPDLGAQIAATPALHPQTDTIAQEMVRGSPIHAVVLTGAEIDQVAGLLHLRERHPFAIYASEETLEAMAGNPMFAVLAPDIVERKPVPLGQPFHVAGVDIELFAIPGKAPLYLESEAPELEQESGANVGVELRAGGRRLLFAPGVAAVNEALATRLAGADVVLFDGTLFTDDEMIRTGTGAKTGRRMGHMPVNGTDGSLAMLSRLTSRRIYIHINNTNPLLVEGSPERRQVAAAGIEVAEDGMEIAL